MRVLQAALILIIIVAIFTLIYLIVEYILKTIVKNRLKRQKHKLDKNVSKLSTGGSGELFKSSTTEIGKSSGPINSLDFGHMGSLADVNVIGVVESKEVGGFVTRVHQIFVTKDKR